MTDLVECTWCKQMIERHDYMDEHVEECKAWQEWENKYWKNG